MSSPSPEVPLQLVGLMPDDTERVIILSSSGRPTTGVVTIGTLPGAIWHRLATQAAVLRQNSVARLVAVIAARGEDPMSPAPDFEAMRAALEERMVRAGLKPEKTDGEAPTRLMVELMKDTEFLEALFAVQLDAAVYAVRSIDGVVDARGNPWAVTFEKTPQGDRLDARSRLVVDRNRDMVAQLWPRIEAMNTLGAPEKKA